MPTVCPICLKACHTFRITNDRRVGGQGRSLEECIGRELENLCQLKSDFLRQWHPEHKQCSTCGRNKDTCNSAKKRRQDKIDQILRENARRKPTAQGARKLLKAQKIIACKPHELSLPMWWRKQPAPQGE